MVKNDQGSSKLGQGTKVAIKTNIHERIGVIICFILMKTSYTVVEGK
jgi:hypothetical protein